MSARVRLVKDVLWFFVFAGLVGMAFRLWFGLGPTTNLSDAVPWGLWKILNMVAGVALATGGFTVGLLVYVLGVERLRPLVKPAILVAFLGYGSSVFALVLDIGMPHRIWHPFLMWNLHSFLFEVAMCVAAYFTVTIVELAPTILERFSRWRALVSFLHRATPAIVIFGITLSSLHHTSLGSLFLVTPQRLHPLWYTTWLPILFITSAMGAGMMVIVLVSLTWARLYEPASLQEIKRPENADDQWNPDRGNRLAMIRTLASTAAGVLAVFLVLKICDLVRTGALMHLFAGTWESFLYVAELGLLGVVPVLLMIHPRARHTAAGMTAAAGSATLGLVLNRLNVGIFGYFRDAQTVYFPSLTEWIVSLGVIAASGIVLLKTAEGFPVFDGEWQRRLASRRHLARSFDNLSGVWRATLGDRLGRVSLVGALTVPLVWALLYPPFHNDDRRSVAVQPPAAADTQRAVLIIDGNNRSMAVAFPHFDHRQRLGGEASCGHCHHLSLPGDHATPCSRCHRTMHESTELFGHSAHMTAVARRDRLSGPHAENRTCSACHRAGHAESARQVKSCLECHEQDMRPSTFFEMPEDLSAAPAYRSVFHTHCAECHRREAATVGKPELAECAGCHPVPSRVDAVENTSVRANYVAPKAEKARRNDRRMARGGL